MDKHSTEAKEARAEIQRLYSKIAYAARGIENRRRHAESQSARSGRAYKYNDSYDAAMIAHQKASDEYHRATGQKT